MASKIPTFNVIRTLNNRIDFWDMKNGSVVKLEGMVVSVFEGDKTVILTDARGQGVWADIIPGHPLTKASETEVTVQGEYYRAPTEEDHDRIVLYTGYN